MRERDVLLKKIESITLEKVFSKTFNQICSKEIVLE